MVVKRQLLAVLLTATIALLADKCGADVPPKKTHPTEDTSDYVTLQFHKFGQLEYGKWYEATGNSACRWWVQTQNADHTGSVIVLESGNYDEALRVRAEVPGKDVFLKFNRACGAFKERVG